MQIKLEVVCISYPFYVLYYLCHDNVEFMKPLRYWTTGFQEAIEQTGSFHRVAFLKNQQIHTF